MFDNIHDNKPEYKRARHCFKCAGYITAERTAGKINMGILPLAAPKD